MSSQSVNHFEGKESKEIQSYSQTTIGEEKSAEIKYDERNNKFQLQSEAAGKLEQFLRTGAGSYTNNPMPSMNNQNINQTQPLMYEVAKNASHNRMTSASEKQMMTSYMTPVNMQTTPVNPEVYWNYNPGPEFYSRKVFVGGLPIDIDEDEIHAKFSLYGPLVVDWPRKNETRVFYPPKGYVFLIYDHEPSVQALVNHCHKENDDKYYICISSPTMKDKPCQVRPWRLAEGDFVVDAALPLDPRKTVFIGGVPRPLKAVELARVMDRLYGGVCYAGIDTDPELKYPKGAARVSFSSQQSFIAAITGRYVKLQHSDIDKMVEVRPYVMDDQMCDECQGQRCGSKYAPFFCAHISCLQYYCDACWPIIHCRSNRKDHKPLVKETVNEDCGSAISRPIAHQHRWSASRNNKR